MQLTCDGRHHRNAVALVNIFSRVCIVNAYWRKDSEHELITAQSTFGLDRCRYGDGRHRVPSAFAIDDQLEHESSGRHRDGPVDDALAVDDVVDEFVHWHVDRGDRYFEFNDGIERAVDDFVHDGSGRRRRG